MAKKQLTAGLLIAAIGMCAAFALSDADFKTKANDDGSVTITGYTGWDKDIAIPANIGGKAVTAIGGGAFNGADLTGVAIPEGVKTIGESAFSGNKLVKVTIAKSVTSIDWRAFANNKLASVVIPDGAVLYDNAFDGNPLAKVTMGADCVFRAPGSSGAGTAGLGRFAFYSYMCNGRKAGTYTVDAKWDRKTAEGYVYVETPYGLAIVDYRGDSKRLSIPDALNGKPVKYIEGLNNKELTGVRIPDGVAVIGEDAFFNNRLTSGAVIGNGVTYIGAEAFSGSRLASVTIGNSVRHIGEGAFRYDNALTAVTIPDSVITIGASAFAGQAPHPDRTGNQIASVTIGKNVKTIGAGAFAYNKLTSVAIPDSVTILTDSQKDWDDGTPGVFEGNQLTAVTLGKGLVHIGARAFADNALTGVTIPNGVKSIGAGAFADNKLTSVAIPDSVTILMDGLNRQYNGRIIMPGVFEGNQLTAVTLGKGLVHIGARAFVGKSSNDYSDKTGNKIAGVTIPNSVKTIGASAFANNRLKSVTIPDSVTTLMDGQRETHTDSLIATAPGVFEGNQLTSVTLGKGLVYIGSYAFSANRLTDVTIPDSVTTIGEEAFKSNQLTSVTVPANVPLASYDYYNDRSSFGWEFGKGYNANGKKAGTYLYFNEEWGLAAEMQSKIDAAKAQEAEKQRLEAEKAAAERRTKELVQKMDALIKDFDGQSNAQKRYNTFVELYKLFIEYKGLGDWQQVYTYGNKVGLRYYAHLSNSQQKSFEKQFGKPSF